MRCHGPAVPSYSLFCIRVYAAGSLPDFSSFLVKVNMRCAGVSVYQRKNQLDSGPYTPASHLQEAAPQTESVIPFKTQDRS
jgi:hypothetical protein